jgi:hypothetical protein
MRSAKFLAFSLVLGMATSLLATGCAEEDEMRAGAEYPVGYTPPGTARMGSAGGATAQAAALPPPPPSVPAGAPDEGQSVAVGEDSPQEQEGAPAAAPGDGTAATATYDDTDPAALTDFRTTLDPYGAWQDDPTYGTVWVPSRTVVGSDFTPYVSAGHWEYDDDYLWVSDYSWGWAPFHYGRWVYGGGGWEWIPGRVYAGAWVSWRYGDDDWAYVGWAPLSPLWCWRGGIAVGIGYVPYAPYAFVGREYLFAPGVGARVVVGAGVGAIAAHTLPWASGGVAGGGRVLAHPTVSGPPPGMLHIQSASVMRASPSTAGLAQARAYARPASAVALGARAPQGYAPANRGAFRTASPYAGAPYAGGGGRGSYSLGASNMPTSSHFGGKLGSGFVGSPSAAPPARSTQAYTARPSYGYSHPSAPSSPSSFPTYRSPASSAPSFHSVAPSYHPSVSAAPSFHGSPGGGSFHSSGSFGGGGGFHGGGGGGFHSGGGGGGHGGGHR